MLKYSIEAQDADGDYVQVADPTRRFADALTALEGLTGEGTYRVRFGRFVKTEKVVEPQAVSPFGEGDIIRTPRGTRDGKVWKVENGTLFYYSLLPDGGLPLNAPTRKVAADKAKLVRKAVSPSAA